MTKQDVIKNAYGEHWDKLKDFVDENGWCKETLIQDDYGEIIKCPSCEHIFHQSKTAYCINSLERCPECNGHVSQYEYHFTFVDSPEDAQKRFGEYRPKSLQGIEDNNGWHKIESEEDLPKLNCGGELHCHIKSSDDCGIGMGIFSQLSNSFKTHFRNDYLNVTHYQPIIKPKAPIY